MTASTPTLSRTSSESLFERISATPRPAVVWTGVLLVLVGLEFGGLAKFGASVLRDAYLATPMTTGTGPFDGLVAAADDIPTLLSRETIPNRGYYDPQAGAYVGTFLGLEPAVAWAIRVALVYLYSTVLLAWLWVGYRWYRQHYRISDWTPRDDVVDRFRDHYWGLFGFAIVFMFVVMVVFAPALGPTTVQENLRNPAGNEIKYYDEASGTVETVNIYSANLQSRSVNSENVGPLSYDKFGRYHPFGTLPSGKDLFTFIAAGSRLSLVMGLLAVSLSSIIAVTLSLLSAYYKGRVDLTFVLVADGVMAMPQLLLLIMLSVIFAGTWIGKIYSGGLLLALILAGTGWPILWRAVRGPALQVAERTWIDAARSFGQHPLVIMRKHILPYIVGYLLIYGSMSLGGVIIAIAGLSFLGLGISPPTPEWGRAVDLGQQYVDGASWHISLIPGVLVTLLVIGFNALGDGIRDAIDPQSDSATGESAGRGGGA